MNKLNGRTYITSQNHGFAIDENSLPDYMKPLFVNCNDNTNEVYICEFLMWIYLTKKVYFKGLIHQNKPIFTCQFHPEGKFSNTLNDLGISWILMII